MGPVPLSAGQIAISPEGVQVQAALVTPAGSGSCSVIADAPRGPSFSALIVKVTVSPGTNAEETVVFSTEMSAGKPSGAFRHSAPSDAEDLMPLAICLREASRGSFVGRLSL